MRKLIFQIKLIVSLCIISTTLYAQSISTVPVNIRLPNGGSKIIRLMKIDLSQNEKKQLSQNISLTLNHVNQISLKSSVYPSYQEVGMNNLPVLDQGGWGTCATFAVTAAVDVLLGLQGTQAVSQLCNLQLGRTLKIPDEKGGWEGSFGNLVLKQIENYGYIPQSYQMTNGCGGLTNYPVSNPSFYGEPMSIQDFNSVSIKAFTARNWKSIHTYSGKFRPINPIRGEKILNEVKKSLLKGNRVVFGMLLDTLEGTAGAVGKYNNVEEDTWVLTLTAIRNVYTDAVAGHEMVIIGYDDKACAYFKERGRSIQHQCGLLHLRNSWSDSMGDHGDFYMSYDYFKAMAIEAYTIVGKD